MWWAGPIEFSTGEIIMILLVLAALALALPTLAGIIAVVLYRRNTPEPQRTRREATIVFFRTAALAPPGPDRRRRGDRLDPGAHRISWPGSSRAGEGPARRSRRNHRLVIGGRCESRTDERAI